MAFLVVFATNQAPRSLFASGLVGRSSAGRFGLTTAKTVTKKRSSALSASFLEELQKTFMSGFSTLADSSSPASTKSKFYTIGITGASGCVGSALRDELSKRDTVNGKPVRIVKLERGTEAEKKELPEDDEAGVISLKWNPKASDPESVIDPAALAQMDAIIHLSGENVATGLGPLGFLGIRPWTDAKKKEILDSRVITTEALSKALAASSSPKSFLVASGVGAYGANFIGEDAPAVDESFDISTSEGFLAEVSRQWEAASTLARGKKNIRLVNMRFAVVMSTKGGALAKLYPIFFLGGGGNVGSGKQYFSFISARDHARAIIHTLETPSLEGPVNFCAPVPCTNAEFTSALGKVLSRPTILPLPAFAVSLLFGEMGDEMLLGGTKATPGKLAKSGFKFEHPTIEEALKSAVKENI